MWQKVYWIRIVDYTFKNKTTTISKLLYFQDQEWTLKFVCMSFEHIYKQFYSQNDLYLCINS